MDHNPLRQSFHIGTSRILPHHPSSSLVITYAFFIPSFSPYLVKK